MLSCWSSKEQYGNSVCMDHIKGLKTDCIELDILNFMTPIHDNVSI